MTCRTGISHWRRGKRCRWVELYLPDYFYGPGPVPRAANDEARTPLEIELGVNDPKEPLARRRLSPGRAQKRTDRRTPPTLSVRDLSASFRDAVYLAFLVLMFLLIWWVLP